MQGIHHQRVLLVNDESRQSDFSEAAEQRSLNHQRGWRREQLGLVVLGS
jgi:hypothetical protein